MCFFFWGGGGVKRDDAGCCVQQLVWSYARCAYASFIHFVSCKLEDTAGIIIALDTALMTPSSILSGDSFYADMHFQCNSPT